MSNLYLICTLVLAGGVVSGMFMYNGMSDWLYSWHYFLTLASAIGAIVTMLVIVFSKRDPVLKILFISVSLMCGGIALFVEKVFLNPSESMRINGFGNEVYAPDANAQVASVALNVATIAGWFALITLFVYLVRVFRRSQ